MPRTPVVASDTEVTKDAAFYSHLLEAEQTAVGRVVPRVLLLRNDTTGSSSLVDQLQQFGCECRIACIREGVALLGKQDFHIVVCELNTSEVYATRLISQLTGSNASLFFHLEVEDGCWWLPTVVTGQDCRGTPALRPKDFYPVLKELLREISSEAHQNSIQDSPVPAELLPGAFTARRQQHSCGTVVNGTLESLSKDPEEYLRQSVSGL